MYILEQKAEGFDIAVFGKDSCFMACCPGLDQLLDAITGKIPPPDRLKNVPSDFLTKTSYAQQLCCPDIRVFS